MEVETKQPTAAVQTIDVYKWIAWAYARRKPLIGGVSAVAVVIIVIALNNWKQGESEASANKMYFRLPSIIASGEKAVRPSASELSSVADAYPGTSIGQQAELLAAQTLFTQGKYPEAMTGFSRFLSAHSSSPLTAQASVGVAACQEALGKTKEAIEAYKKVIVEYSATGVTTPIKLTLARLFEEEKNFEMALSYYDELTSSPTVNPYDPWGAEARERKLALLTLHPELNRVSATAPARAPLAPAPSALKPPVNSAPKTK